MKINKYFIILLFTITISSCEKDEGVNNTNDVPVIESFLSPNNEIYVKLSKMYTFSENDTLDNLSINSVEVNIVHNSINYILTPSEDGTGMYTNNDEDLKVVVGDSYKLFFEYHGFDVSSETTIPSKPVNVSSNYRNYTVSSGMMGGQQNPLTISWDNTDNSYHQISIKYLDDEFDPINTNMEEEDLIESRIVSIAPVSNDAYDLRVRNDLKFYGDYQIIVFKVNEDYVEITEESDDSSFSLSEPKTNIKNGLGIFAGINSDTIQVTVKRE
jgi:hypothetical protein